MPANSPFLFRLLCLQVLDRHFRGDILGGSRPERWFNGVGSLPWIFAGRWPSIPDRNSQSCRGRHAITSADRKNDGLVSDKDQAVARTRISLIEWPGFQYKGSSQGTIRTLISITTRAKGTPI